MQDETLLPLISDTAELLGLEATVIEKDYYVTQVIHALSNIENENFRLIFCGGTCLAKAHKLVQRMSEDVDFKVQLKSNGNVSKSRLKKELKEFRLLIRSKLFFPHLSVTNDVSRNEGRYQQITLKYSHSFPVSLALRPDVKVEFTFASILLSIDRLEVKTLIENTIKEVDLFPSTITKCISIDETAAEKWVGLTRRLIAIERGHEEDDKTLIRHLYDLNAIYQTNKINSNFIDVAKIVVIDDGKQFKNQHPEYAIDPKAETKRSR